MLICLKSLKIPERVIRSRKWTKDRQHKRKSTNNDLQMLYRRLKIEQHETHENPGVNSGAPEGYVVPAPYVIPSQNAIIQFIYLSYFILNYNNTHILGIETRSNK
jgi:hypothetical protein